MHNKKSPPGKKGFTLTEALVVVGIIAIICAIAIPSIISINKSLSFKQKNDYAKSIFLAAQSNLTEMRSNGRLKTLQTGGSNVAGSKAIDKVKTGFTATDPNNEYVYTLSGTTAFDAVLPAGSIDGSVRDKTILIEYNPVTGNVFSVFYSENMTPAEMENAYNKTASYPEGLPREDSRRKPMNLGYYCGDGLTSNTLQDSRSTTSMRYEDGEEGIVVISVSIPVQYQSGRHNVFAKGLSVDMTITGPGGASFSVPVKTAGNTDRCSLSVDALHVDIKYPLDSLADHGSFANISADKTNASIISIKNESEFRVLPGEVLSLQADVNFDAPSGSTLVTTEPGILGGVNPLYEYIRPSTTDPSKVVVGIANGRHLQNLNIMPPSIAKKVESISFSKDIDWESTVNYYNVNHRQPGKAQYTNDLSEAPAKGLPYFVPINHEELFGTARFIFKGEGNPDLAEIVGTILGQNLGGKVGLLERIPYLTDEVDRDPATDMPVKPHAVVHGNNHKVKNLYMDATHFKTPASANEAKFYATGKSQFVDYNFTGLFGYVNTSIDGVQIVDPIIKGQNLITDREDLVPIYELKIVNGRFQWRIKDYIKAHIHNNPATGALVGATGYNSLITNCGVYVEDMNHYRTHRQSAYDPNGTQTWIGVSGGGAVGGLVGYAKSHKTVSGELTNAENHLAFRKSFAAVPVSGIMRNTGNKHYGYSNGVGGLVGNSQLTNFYDCYASGNVMASGYYVETRESGGLITELLGLSHNGRTSYGAGGFVGTSHGTRYTNCFATGEVHASGTHSRSGSGAGGFVGFMCYDETRFYGTDGDTTPNVEIAQHTVFSNCYAVGLCNGGSGYAENFSGANGRVRVTSNNMKAYYSPDYYKLLAPYALANNGALPTYDRKYIFKDSYYLSQYKTVSQDSSNKCASAIAYDTLTGLPEKYRTEQFRRDTLLKALKDQDASYRIFKDVLEIAFKGNLAASNALIKELIGDIWNQFWKDPLNIKVKFNTYFKAAEAMNRPLEGTYMAQYGNAFRLGADQWMAENQKAGKTHRYSQNNSGQVFPFPQLAGMDYYGDWPDKPLAAGLAYFEDYGLKGGSGEEIRGYYLDRDSTSSLRDDLKIVYDGYAILTSTNDPLYISLDGKPYGKALQPKEYINLGSRERPDGSAYYVTELPKDIVDKISKTEFYTKMTVTIPADSATGQAGKSFIVYFNPNVALTQVNPANGRNPNKPLSVPDPLLIRSARQFRMLSQMSHCWKEGFHYEQQFDLDSAIYHWDKTNIQKPYVSYIGNSAVPFNGSYTAVKQTVLGTDGVPTSQQRKSFIKGFTPNNTAADAGLFGVIGKTGSVSQLDLPMLLKEVCGSTASNTVGIVAGKNSGTIKDIDLTVSTTADLKKISLMAADSAGILAGYSDGTVTDCKISIQDKIPVELSARYAGAALGETGGGTVQRVTYTQTGVLSPKAERAGGFVGNSSGTAYDVVRVNLAGIDATADYAGGFAGRLADGSLNPNHTVRSVNVTLDGPLSAKAFSANGDSLASVAGFAARAVNVILENTHTTLNGALTGDNAAGFMGYVTDVRGQNTTVTANADIKATTIASGFACSIDNDKGNGIRNAVVTLNSASIRSDDRAAGFVLKAVNEQNATPDSHNSAYQLSRSKVVFQGNGSTITGAKMVAGFAGSIENSALHECRVYGTGKILSDARASGFADTISGTNGRTILCGVTPVVDHIPQNYHGNSNKNLSVKAPDAAGFALTISKAPASDAPMVNVLNSFTLCSVEGSTSSTGFIKANGGYIVGSTANVDLTGGFAFIGTNTGTVMDSYGWYGDGKKANNTQVVPTDAAGKYTGTGTYTGCYFVDRDRPVVLVPENVNPDKLAKFKTAVVFDSKSQMSTMLACSISPEILNRSFSTWQPAKHFPAHPYGDPFFPEYPLPMLRDHYGDWADLADATCGIVYYEVYKNGDKLEVGVMPKNTCDIEYGVPEKPINMHDDLPIVKASYAAFYMKGLDPKHIPFHEEQLEGEVKEIDPDIFGTGIDYTFRQIHITYDAAHEIETIIPIHSPEYKTSFGPFFAREFDVKDTFFEIRTGDQLGNIAIVNPDTQRIFNQTVDVKSENFNTVPKFQGIYHGLNNEIVADNPGTFMETVDGIIDGITKIEVGKPGAATPVDKHLFGTINDSKTVSIGNMTFNGGVSSPTGIIETTLSSSRVDCPTIKIDGDISGTLVKNAGGFLYFDHITAHNINKGASLFEDVINGAVFLSDPGDSITVNDINGCIINTVGPKSNISVNEINANNVNGTLMNSIDSAHINLEGKCVTTINIKGSLNAPVIGIAKNTEIKQVHLNAANAKLNTNGKVISALLSAAQKNCNVHDCTVAIKNLTVVGKGGFGFVVGSCDKTSSVSNCTVNPAPGATTTITAEPSVVKRSDVVGKNEGTSSGNKVNGLK